MSTQIIQSPSSQRSDNKVWVWTYGDPVYVPVRVKFIDKSTGELYAAVPDGYYAGLFIKADLRDETAVINKVFNFNDSSIFVIDLSVEEVMLLRAGRRYYVGLALYNELGEFVRTLVADLPLQVEKSALYRSVF